MTLHRFFGPFLTFLGTEKFILQTVLLFELYDVGFRSFYFLDIFWELFLKITFSDDASFRTSFFTLHLFLEPFLTFLGSEKFILQTVILLELYGVGFGSFYFLDIFWELFLKITFSDDVSFRTSFFTLHLFLEPFLTFLGSEKFILQTVILLELYGVGFGSFKFWDNFWELFLEITFSDDVSFRT